MQPIMATSMASLTSSSCSSTALTTEMTSKFCLEQPGASDDADPALSQAQRFENIPADFNFLHRIGRQRYAQSIANALGQQHAPNPWLI